MEKQLFLFYQEQVFQTGSCVAQLESGTAANPASDVAGDTLTLAATTAVNGRVKLTCVSDDGTNSTWKAETLSTPIATSA